MARNPASRVTITEIPLDKLVIPEYQRKKVNWKRINRMIEHYDPYLDHPMEVAPLANGMFAIVSGQHRYHCKKALKHNTATCRIVRRSPENEQAQYFLDIDTERTPVHGLDKFRTALTARDEECIAIDNAMAAAGFRFSGIDRDDRPIAAVGAIKKAYRLGGEDLVTETLTLINDAWPGDKEALKAYYITGIAQFLHEYAGQFDMGRLKQRLAATRPIELKHKGASYADFSSQHLHGKGMARAIAVMYNFRLREESRLEIRG